MRAFPSWFLRITCDRCGKDRMLNEVHMARAPARHAAEYGLGPTKVACSPAPILASDGANLRRPLPQVLPRAVPDLPVPVPRR